MKKVALSGVVIIAFILYGLHQRDQVSEAGVVIAPKNLITASASPEASLTPNPSSPPTTTPTPIATPDTTASVVVSSTPTSSPTPAPTSTGAFKNGTYTGSVADANYGSVQVQAIVSGGRLTTVNFLQYPNTHPTSVQINSQAMPYLQQEAIQAQSANVNIISGATLTSQAFIQSLGSALSQAQ